MAKKSLVFISVLFLVFSGVTVLLTFSEIVNPRYIQLEGEGKKMEEKPQVFESPQSYGSVSRISTQWASFILSLTYEKLFDSSNLIAIIEISSPSMTYYKARSYFFTIHTAKVVEILKGNLEGDEIHLFVSGGYDPEAKQFYVTEGCPVFVKGDKWLVFLGKYYDYYQYESIKIDLPKNTHYLSPAFMGLKIINGKLYTMEDTGPFPAPQLMVKDLTIEEFKSLYKR